MYAAKKANPLSAQPDILLALPQEVMLSETSPDKLIAVRLLLDAIRRAIGNGTFNGELAPLIPHRAIRVKEVMHITGDKRSHFYARLNAKSPAHDPTFPRPFYVGRSPRWWHHSIVEWLDAKASSKAA